MAEVSVVACGPGWAVACSVHGVLPTLWVSPALAGFDALGHGSTFHRVLRDDHDRGAG